MIDAVSYGVSSWSSPGALRAKTCDRSAPLVSRHDA
jgi:hypothetical protein